MDIEEPIIGEPPVVEPPPMDLILNWIGFDHQPAIRERIRTEGFESFDDIRESEPVVNTEFFGDLSQNSFHDKGIRSTPEIICFFVLLYK